MQTGFIAREDQVKLESALGQLVESRLFIDDTAGISLAEMRAKARRLKQNAGGLNLIVVDYLGDLYLRERLAVRNVYQERGHG